MPKAAIEHYNLRPEAGPAHVQIERWFLEAVEEGMLAPGDQLPAEKDLAVSFGVSRMTLRHALGRLSDRGLVNRVPGRRGGTFVAEPSITCDLTEFTGLTEHVERAHALAGAQVISARTQPASSAVARALGLEPEALVHTIVRLRTAGKTPVALEESHIPAHLCPGLLEHPLTGSLYALMRALHTEPASATEYLEPMVATAEQAVLLQVDRGAPLMRVTRTASTQEGVAVEFAHDILRPDRMRVLVRRVLAPPPGAR